MRRSIGLMITSVCKLLNPSNTVPQLGVAANGCLVPTCYLETLPLARLSNDLQVVLVEHCTGVCSP
jgi:hypothetical protein